MFRILTIAARIVVVLGIGFISVFALDVFGPGQSVVETALALLMHLLPSLGLLAVLALAWRWPLIGGLVYLALAALAFVLLANPPLVNLTLAGPFALAGLLFLAAALTRPRPQGSA